MIKFFRKIRQRLLSENKFRKYLLYAIGEIVLVVVGILIALQVNNWNEGQKARAIEVIILTDLKENIELNILVLNEMISLVEWYDRSGKLVHNALKNGNYKANFTAEDWQSSLMSGSDLMLSQAGYESLKNRGFEIISNSNLRKAIIGHFENTYLNLGSIQMWGSEMISYADPFIVENFIKHNDEAGTPIFGLTPRDPKYVFSNHYFFGLVDVARSQRTYYVRKYKIFLKEHEKILQLIKDELNK